MEDRKDDNILAFAFHSVILFLSSLFYVNFFIIKKNYIKLSQVIFIHTNSEAAAATIRDAVHDHDHVDG